ncbi:MAG: cytochrome c oxidase assembly factor Coa1 family protein [Myxococcota bacterium]
MTPNPSAPAPQPGWFSRNWKWLVPVACIVPTLCCVTFGAVAYFGASKMIQASPVFAMAMAKASSNPEVQATLGTPLAPGLGLNGGYNEKNGSGTADFSLPLEGPKGKGTLVVKATGRGGSWNFQVLEVEAGGKRINLLDDAPPTDEPEQPEGD